MATLEEKLALSKKMTHIEKTAQQSNLMPSSPQYTFNNPTQTTRPYNAKEEMQRIKKGLPKDLSNCKLPTAILESIVKNPINTDVGYESEMDTFTQNLGESLGLKKSAALMEQLDNVQVNPQTNSVVVNENKQPTQNSGIDYEMIKLLIENAIDKKLESFTQTLNTLNESKQMSKGNNVKTMSFGDKFLFLDSDDNVYECEMKYKGKRKRK